MNDAACDAVGLPTNLSSFVILGLDPRIHALPIGKERPMTVSPFDHPYLSGLLGDEAVAALFSVAAELEAMLAFEVALARAEAEAGVIPADAAGAIEAAAHRFSPDVASLRAATARDGVVVPDFVRQLRAAVGEPHGRHVHVGATSQDVVDSGLMLRLSRVLPVLEKRLGGLAGVLDGLAATFGDRELMGRTRMQAAIPITVADRVGAWRAPLERHRTRVTGLMEEGLAVQFGGAAGTLEKLGEKAPAVRAALARNLGLADAPQWHSQRDSILDLAALLSGITGSLGKIGQDIAAAVRAVEGRGGVSVLGFCLGGGLALQAATELALAGAVSYYGTRLGSLLEKPPRCPMLFHFGATDTHSPPEVSAAVKKAIPAAETYVYPAGHAFANDARTTYVKDAAEAAHARTIEFLRKVHAR